jgi:hypothetical protein
MIMIKNFVIAAGLLMTAAAMSTPALAENPDKHDSNTLHKIGKAIQYPVRKDAENLSVDTHRSENRDSRVSLRHQKATAEITPNGDKFVVAHRGNAVYAHRHHHTRGWYRRHHMSYPY